MLPKESVCLSYTIFSLALNLISRSSAKRMAPAPPILIFVINYSYKGVDEMHFISSGGAFRDAPSLLEIFYARMSFSRLHNSSRDKFLAEECLRTRVTRSTVYTRTVIHGVLHEKPLRDPLCKLCLRTVECVQSHLEIIVWR